MLCCAVDAQEDTSKAIFYSDCVTCFYFCSYLYPQSQPISLETEISFYLFHSSRVGARYCAQWRERLSHRPWPSWSRASPFGHRPRKEYDASHKENRWKGSKLEGKDKEKRSANNIRNSMESLFECVHRSRHTHKSDIRCKLLST